MRDARAQALPAVIPAAIAAAWILTAAAQFSGSARFLHHDTLIERGPPIELAIALFLAAWLVMIGAMMLPSTLPLLRLFAVVSSSQPSRGAMLAAFTGGYVAVWCLFGAGAFAGDVVVHRLVDANAWLGAHRFVVAGAVLAGAGAFQFTPLKEQCLQKCRLPATYLLHHYRRGARAAFRLGSSHAVFCVGCCWALMLVAFAAGFASLWWMAALTALMLCEKTMRHGRAAVPVAGALFLVWGALVLAHPPWLPAVFAGSE